MYSNDKRTYRPYQLITKQVMKNGNYSTYVTVSRITIHKFTHTKLCQTGSTGLKFVLQEKPLTGNRIINLEVWQERVADISTHSCFCFKAQLLALEGKTPIVLKSETSQSGLCSIIVGQCKGCFKKFS